jgi:hypothetical protein
MKTDDIMIEITKHDTVIFGNGEFYVSKKLDSIIGGVKVYNLLLYSGESAVPVEFNDFAEFADYGIINEEGVDIHRCAVCGDFVDAYADYYKDNEHNQTFCNVDCLMNWLDRVYGEDGWLPAEVVTNDEELFDNFVVKMREGETTLLPTFDYNGVHWRLYDCDFVEYRGGILLQKYNQFKKNLSESK